MTESNTQKPAGYTAGGSSFAGQQAGPSIGEPAQAGSQYGESTGSTLAGEARSKAGKMAEQAKGLVRSRMSERAGSTANEMAELARTLRQTGRQLEGKVASPLVNRAADQLDRVAELLESNDPDELVRNVERFARQQPLLFLGGAFALGVAAARFLKSSAAHEQQQTTGEAYEEFGEPLVGGGSVPTEFRP